MTSDEAKHRPDVKWHTYGTLARPRYAEPSDCRVEVSCIWCSRSFWVWRGYAGRYESCGMACKRAYLDHKKRDRARACLTCGSMFSPRPNQISAGHGVYCSRKCNVSGLSAMHEQSVKDKKAEKMKLLAEAGFFKKPVGPDSPNWKGGIKETTRRYVESGSNRVAKARRRAREATGDGFTREDVRHLLALQRNTCVICRGSLKKYHVDHITPLAKGGTNDKHNIQLLCPKCNMTKNAKDPIAFMQSNGYLL